jgi:hypothetical protein
MLVSIFSRCIDDIAIGARASAKVSGSQVSDSRLINSCECISPPLSEQCVSIQGSRRCRGCEAASFSGSRAYGHIHGDILSTFMLERKCLMKSGLFLAVVSTNNY